MFGRYSHLNTRKFIYLNSTSSQNTASDFSVREVDLQTNEICFYRPHSEGMGKVMFSPVSVCLFTSQVRRGVPHPADGVPHLVIGGYHQLAGHGTPPHTSVGLGYYPGWDWMGVLPLSETEQ